MRVHLVLLWFLFLLGLAGCSDDPQPQPAPEVAPEPVAGAVETPRTLADLAPAERLAAVLDAQPEEVKARYRYRNPAETLDFFGIQPGQTVVELLPGGGWYSKILLPYLGADGQLIGADYPVDLFRLFGFMTEEQIAAKESWVADWTATAEGWRGADDARVAAFQLAALPAAMVGTADAVLAIRALHNLARFETQGGHMTAALQDIHAVLKPGGIVGVVQHEAPAEMPDDWAAGPAGYLKRAFVIERFEAAGFEFVDGSDVNANPADQPTVEDSVWRLAPSLSTSRDDPELRETMQAIGESNRMTLMFRKPFE
jgi:predicted methyltransferase